MPPLSNNNQQLDESEIMDSLANKAPRTHKVMLISQGFNPETGDFETFVEHYERDVNTNNIFMAKFTASDKDSKTTKNKKRSKKTKECEDSGKKCLKNPSLYCSLHGENTRHTSRESKVLKARAAEKDKPKYFKKE